MKSNHLIATALVAAVMSVTAATGARASFEDGNSLYQACQDKNHYALGACMGYVRGVADAMSSGSKVNGFTSCWSGRHVTAGQLMDVSTQYLVKHPERRQSLALELVAQALGEAFPCL